MGARQITAVGIMWLLSILTTQMGYSTVVTVGPSNDWCGAIGAAQPGDEIVLLPGSYRDPCAIYVTGMAALPILIRAQSQQSGQRSIMSYTGASSNVIDLYGTYVTIRGLSFAATQEDVDAIRIRSGHDLIIEQNLFTGIGGVSIPSNNADIGRLTIRDNTFDHVRNTAIYLGCHDGTACHATDLVVERNFVNGVDPLDPQGIGYALEVKLNSYGTIRDNTMYGMKGPGIMVYGSNRGDPASVIEGNYVEGSLTEGGIVVGGGPAIVRNNVLVGNAYGGISAQDYGGRNLQTNVWLVHNTILNNYDSGINVQNWQAGRGNVIAMNAIFPRAGTLALSPNFPAGTIMGNVTCSTPATCWVQPTTTPYDLWPTAPGPLADAAGSGPEPWRPVNDFMGVLRGSVADVGAFERTSSTIYHLVGGGNPRPPRVSTDATPPSAPTNLRVQ